MIEIPLPELNAVNIAASAPFLVLALLFYLRHLHKCIHRVEDQSKKGERLILNRMDKQEERLSNNRRGMHEKINILSGDIKGFMVAHDMNEKRIDKLERKAYNIPPEN